MLGHKGFGELVTKGLERSVTGAGELMEIVTWTRERARVAPGEERGAHRARQGDAREGDRREDVTGSLRRIVADALGAP